MPEAIEDLQLTKLEKIRRIKAAIRQKKLPPWADPSYGKRPAQNLLDQFENRDCITKFHDRVQNATDFRKWYDAVYSPKYAQRREEARENAAAERARHQRGLFFSDRQKELQNVLYKDYAQEQQEGAKIQSDKPTRLDEMRVKAEHLRAKHEAQERNYVDQQYERIWKNGMSADKLRNLEYVKHKYDAVKHLGEQMLYKALDEMEDSQVDEFYHALAKESAAKEQAQLQAEAEEKHKLEQQAQQRIQEQIQQNADNKKQRKMQRLVERDKTLFKSEQLRFDSFREDFQRRLEEKTKRSEIHTKEHNSIHEERQQALQREQKEAEETIKYLEKEKTERLAAEKKAKSQLRQEYFAQQQYSQQLMSASGNDALDKHIAEMQREQQYEALYTFLNNLKARQGLQYRINKELDNQIHIKGLDKVHRRKEKEQEKEQQAVEAALFLKRREEVEALRRQQALENADILRYQIQDRKEREKALADGTTEFFQTQKKNQEEEDAHIRLLAQSMLSSM